MTPLPAGLMLSTSFWPHLHWRICGWHDLALHVLMQPRQPDSLWHASSEDGHLHLSKRKTAGTTIPWSEASRCGGGSAQVSRNTTIRSKPMKKKTATQLLCPPVCVHVCLFSLFVCAQLRWANAFSDACTLFFPVNYFAYVSVVRGRHASLARTRVFVVAFVNRHNWPLAAYRSHTDKRPRNNIIPPCDGKFDCQNLGQVLVSVLQVDAP